MGGLASSVGGYTPHLDIEEAEAQVCPLLGLSLGIMGLRPVPKA